MTHLFVNPETSKKITIRNTIITPLAEPHISKNSCLKNRENFFRSVFSDPYFHCHVQSLMLWVLTTCCLHAAIGRETLVPSVEILARGAVRRLLVRRGRRGRSTCRSHRKGAWCAQEGTWLRSFGNSYLCRDSALVAEPTGSRLPL